MDHQPQTLTPRLMQVLYLAWIVSAGAIAAMVVLALFVPKPWLPLPVVAMGLGLGRFREWMRSHGGRKCTAMIQVSMLTMLWSALIMLIIVLIRRYWPTATFFTWSAPNAQIPFVTSLIEFPVLTVMSLWVMLRGYGQSFAERYRLRDGSTTGNGVLASIFSSENRYQVRLLFAIGVTMSVVEWWYFYQYYYNENMNTPDKFFFNYMPAGMYAISLFFVWSRYNSLSRVLGPIVRTTNGQGVLLRFLVFDGDRLLMKTNEFGRWDTPAATYIPTLHQADTEQARRVFARISGLSDFAMRPLYATAAGVSLRDTEHLAVFVADDTIPEAWAGAEWFTLDKIDRMVKHAEMAPDLTDEIYRIYTMTMAWKTYDREGLRRYPIKNYRPTFRLGDLKDWDLDYGDLWWLRVARLNQDRPLFRLRRALNRLASPQRP